MVQGYASLNWPTKQLEELLLAGKLAHGGHPVLRWTAGGARLETVAAGNWKPSKKRSRERIAGIVPLFMEVGRARLQQAPVQAGTFYDTHTLEFIEGSEVFSPHAAGGDRNCRK